ncbi:heavy-metal-associated domain-containing protein, partial [Klebsiella pneumoniae]|nr:heavy-metal-associated domain-containing protein [Klebsiella pneumoniae]
MSECASKGCGCTTEPIIQPTAPAPLATGSAQAVYRIENMDCPTEETLIRNKLGTVAGVADLDFNLMQRTLSVRHANQVLPDVLVALQALGFEAQV